jgi:hypothetical protein
MAFQNNDEQREEPSEAVQSIPYGLRLKRFKSAYPQHAIS